KRRGRRGGGVAVVAPEVSADVIVFVSAFRYSLTLVVVPVRGPGSRIPAPYFRSALPGVLRQVVERRIEQPVLDEQLHHLLGALEVGLGARDEARERDLRGELGRQRRE